MNPTCKQCGQREVEDARVCYATPVCFACLPPPPPLNTAWSLPAVWLADMADALGHVRHEDSGPRPLTPKTLLELVRELREERDTARADLAATRRALDELTRGRRLEMSIDEVVDMYRREEER